MKKNILVTGAGSGFGKGIALDLANKGHNVVATVQIPQQKTELLAIACEQSLDLTVEVVDITKKLDRAKIYAYDIDVLINNAGIMEAGPVAEMPMEIVRSNFETNVFSTLAVIQGVAPQMVKRGAGKIISVSSIAGLVTMPFGSVYSATKQALEAVMEGLTLELQGTGVNVCVVNPGMYKTGFNDRGVETMFNWFDPESSLSPKELLEPIAGLLEDQLDPQEQIDDVVRIVEEDTSSFRNVCPPVLLGWLKEVEVKAWSAKSDEPIWVDMPGSN